MLSESRWTQSLADDCALTRTRKFTAIEAMGQGARCCPGHVARLALTISYASGRRDPNTEQTTDAHCPQLVVASGVGDVACEMR